MSLVLATGCEPDRQPDRFERGDIGSPGVSADAHVALPDVHPPSPVDAGQPAPDGTPGCEGCRDFACIPGLDGESMCTTLCNPDAPDCPCGFDCRFVNNGGADSTWLCAPRAHSLCAACESDDDCVGSAAGARCIAGEGGRYCGLGCADGCCPGGYACTDGQCRPEGGGSCADCVDDDQDGYGRGEGCAGPDCDDARVDVNPGAAEQCNGRDDDCDGSIDESLASPADGCLTNGVCRGVEARCVDGGWQCAYPESYEAEERRCDGLDNDCDGLVDEVAGRGDPCEVGIGACRMAGMMDCAPDGDGLACSGRPNQPVDELCNGVDDDCDGALDEVAGVGVPCEGGLGACRRAGRMVCDAERGQVRCDAAEAAPEPERCDNRDNDCDGRVDEGEGTCPPQPEPERCNDADDDLDGTVDEDLVRPCESQCGVGTERCVAGAFVDCDAPMPAAEACNGRDDDCDGRTDEAVVRECRTACGVGEERCVDGGFVGCDAQMPVAERCDGLDDDCDGEIDEEACGPCERQPDGTVIAVEEWTACAYDDACDEAGRRERMVMVCRGGEVVGEHEVEVGGTCGRETDGDMVVAPPWGDCGGFATACGETGEAVRTAQVCRDGAVVAEAQSRQCERETDGLRVAEGEWGACGQFESDCGELGRRVRGVTVCRNGIPEEEEDSEACERDTDDLLIDEGEWGGCAEFSDDCDETGVERRPIVVCRDGQLLPQSETRPCGRETHGVILTPGEWGECMYAEACAEAGIRRRVVQICRDGVAVEETERDEGICDRDTDGLRVGEGDWGECAYADTCVETGRRERLVQLCRAGEAVDEIEPDVEGCDRDTEGTRLDEPDWGECAYVDDCVEDGRRGRVVRLCRAGEAVDEAEHDVEGCGRATEGTRLDEPDWGECVYADDCVEDGRRGRVVRLCRAGEAVDEAEHDVEGCGRDTDGTRLDEDPWGECVYADACIERGERQRGFQVCAGGLTVPGVDTEACARETDGIYLVGGEWGDCAYADDCVEAGEREREVRICRDGTARDETEHDVEFCDRETDGRRVREGEWTPCGEYDGPCDEGGLRTRPIEVCAAGQVSADTDRDACARDTDGVVVDVGPWGSCGGFDEPCGEVGQQSRLRRVCQDGESVDDPESRACPRETDGDVVFTGPWTECDYRDVCDEDAERQRERRVCRNGEPNLEPEVERCRRETDGRFVEEGPWTRCDWSSDCDERARRCHDLTTCRDGLMYERESCEECRRDTDGTIVWTGDWGPCMYPSECSERGTQERQVHVCRDGWPDDDREIRPCNRNRDGRACDGGRGTCGDGECVPNPEVCDGIDNDGDGFIDNVPHGEFSCFYFITHHTQCEFHSMHGVWQTRVGHGEERGAFTCPPSPERLVNFDCHNCPMQRAWCGGPEIDGGQRFYDTCWRQADGNMLRTYRASRPALGFTRELKQCWDAFSFEVDYIVEGRCADLGPGWRDGPHRTMGYIAENQPAGRFEEPVHQYRVCEQPREDGFTNRWISRGCPPGDRGRVLGWAIGP